MHGLLHDNYDIINLIKKFPVISKCYPISTSTASTYVWLKGQKGGKINGNSKKKQRQLLCFSFFIISKKINLSLLEFFFSNKCSCTTALFFAVPTPKTTILLWLGKWVLNIQKNRKITISSIVYYKYYICFLNVMHCVCLCHYHHDDHLLKKKSPKFQNTSAAKEAFWKQGARVIISMVF